MAAKNNDEGNGKPKPKYPLVFSHDMYDRWARQDPDDSSSPRIESSDEEDYFTCHLADMSARYATDQQTLSVSQWRHQVTAMSDPEPNRSPTRRCRDRNLDAAMMSRHDWGMTEEGEVVGGEWDLEPNRTRTRRCRDRNLDAAMMSRHDWGMTEEGEGVGGEWDLEPNHPLIQRCHDRNLGVGMTSRHGWGRDEEGAVGGESVPGVDRAWGGEEAIAMGGHAEEDEHEEKKDKEKEVDKNSDKEIDDEEEEEIDLEPEYLHMLRMFIASGFGEIN